MFDTLLLIAFLLKISKQYKKNQTQQDMAVDTFIECLNQSKL